MSLTFDGLADDDGDGDENDGNNDDDDDDDDDTDVGNIGVDIDVEDDVNGAAENGDGVANLNGVANDAGFGTNFFTASTAFNAAFNSSVCGCRGGGFSVIFAISALTSGSSANSLNFFITAGAVFSIMTKFSGLILHKIAPFKNSISHISCGE